MLNTISGGRRLLFFYERLQPFDLRSIERQMQERKFDPALIFGTSGRCRFGCPRVIVCSPLKGITPFPTSFWLTCPWLVRFIGSIESGGGVGELERWLESNAHREWLLFNMDHQLARMALLSPKSLRFLRRFKPGIFDRLSRDGVGGIRYDGYSPIRVKCIHLQVASWLAFRHHPGEKWLEGRGAGQDCGGKTIELCLARKRS